MQKEQVKKKITLIRPKGKEQEKYETELITFARPGRIDYHTMIDVG